MDSPQGSIPLKPRISRTQTYTRGNLHAWKSRMVRVNRYTIINQNKANMDPINWKRKHFSKASLFNFRFHVKFQCPKCLNQYWRFKKKMHFHPASLFPPAISVLSGSGSTKSKSGRDKAINGFTLWAVETTKFKFMCLKGQCTHYLPIIIYC